MKKIENIQINLKDDYPPSPKFGSIPEQKYKKTVPQIAGKYGQSQHQFIKMSQKKIPNKQQQKQITIQQLSKNSKKQSAWLSLKGIVYDVTQYRRFHPGGDEILVACGQQADQYFNYYHPWVNAKNLLSKYKLGTLKK